jgi:chromosomal replication initiator protein
VESNAQDLTAQTLWSKALDRLKIQLSPPTFDTWIKTATPEKLEDDCLILKTPNPFSRNWIQKYYIETIATALKEITGTVISVQVIVDESELAAISAALKASSGPQRIKTPDPPVAKDHDSQYSALNQKYVFSRLVVGPNNRMAHAASLAVAESPGREFNPLFLCGGVGLGKTHLMQSIGHYRLEIDPNARIYYVSTEQFTNDLITAIRKDNMQSFRDLYRAVDVLLVDDIQFIEGKEYTQEEFFHTFNTLHESGKQVVLASDRPPTQIPRLQERLCSRFSMGLIADIQSPDFETRMAILQKKAEYEKMDLPREVIEYIAANYTNNIRELEGAMTRAVAYISIAGLPMTVANITPVLNPPVEKIEVSPNSILEALVATFNVTIEDLKGASRKREISFSRQVGMYLMRQHTTLSLPKIGEVFGGKDHTTVLYACEKMTQLQGKDAETAKMLRQLSERLNARR